jgi:hypothetical protein
MRDGMDRFLTTHFDAFLCRAIGVFSFSDDPACLIRLQLGRAPHAIFLPDCTIPAGASAAMLHLWNEHMPRIPPGGPTLAWAHHFQRGLVGSFQSAAAWIGVEPRFANIRVVGGVLALLPQDQNSGSVQLMQRLGFTVFPYQGRFGRFGEFWENWYSWQLLKAYNPASLRHRRLFDLHRSEIWMEARAFLHRYRGEKASGAPANELSDPAFQI